MEFDHIDGSDVPRLGFGTFMMEGQTCFESVKDALKIGYRHIDTARIYGNESEVGEAIAQSGLKREDIFLTSKLWRDELRGEQVGPAVSSSLKNLQTDYLDLCLIHWPVDDVPVAETIEAMRQEQQKGKIKHLGVSNFTTYYLEQIEKSGIRTITNQVEYHAMLDQSALRKKLKVMNMTLSAYSPLARGRLIDHPLLDEIGEKYDKSSSQVALRWLLDQDDVWVLPKSATHERRKSNFELFDFQLDEEDHMTINNEFEKNKRVINPEFAPSWD